MDNFKTEKGLELEYAGKIEEKGKQMNEQQKKWAGEFGREYTERNTDTPFGLDQEYLKKYGVTRTKMNLDFLNLLDRNITILDYGCNIGLQSALLKYIGFDDLVGFDINFKAANKAYLKRYLRFPLSESDIIYCSKFDLVFTSGVLIHQPPEELDKVMDEMIRLSKEYIWGMEYYANELTEIPYRGNSNMMWKGNYCDMFIDKGLELIKRKKYTRTDGNVDEMYLLRKKI